MRGKSELFFSLHSTGLVFCFVFGENLGDSFGSFVFLANLTNSLSLSLNVWYNHLYL